MIAGTFACLATCSGASPMVGTSYGVIIKMWCLHFIIAGNLDSLLVPSLCPGGIHSTVQRNKSTQNVALYSNHTWSPKSYVREMELYHPALAVLTYLTTGAKVDYHIVIRQCVHI